MFYYTPGSKERVGLGPLVIGLVRAVAELQFGIMSLVIQQHKTSEDGTIEFTMEWEDDSTLKRKIIALIGWLMEFIGEDDSEDTIELAKYDIGLNPTAFARVQF
jgi:hypothetical protein